MKRSTGLVLGVLVCLVGFAAGSGTVRAGEEDGDERRVRIEKRVKVVTFGGPGFLGVGLEEVDGGSGGAKVRSVRPESAAASAGLEEGDVVTRFDGEGVRSARQLGRLVSETPPGREVAIEVQRDGVPRTLSATLTEGPHWLHGGDRSAQVHLGEGNLFVPGGEDFDIEIDVPKGLHGPDGEGPHVLRWHSDDRHDFTGALFASRPRLGIRFIELGEQLADYFRVAADDGVLVTSVEEASPAARAGIKAGDVLMEFEGTPIHRGRDLLKAVGKAEAGSAVAVKLQREGRAMDVQVTLPEPESRKRPHAAGVSL